MSSCSASPGEVAPKLHLQELRCLPRGTLTDHFDFKHGRPLPSSNKQAIILGVVCYAIQHRYSLLIRWLAGSSPVRSIRAITCPSCGEIRAIRSECQTLA